MATRINLRISYEATDAQDGSKFDDGSKGYFDLPVSDYAEMQGDILQLLAKWQAWAVEDAKRKSKAK